MRLLWVVIALVISLIGVFFATIPILPIIIEALAVIAFSMVFEKGKWLYLALFFIMILLIITNFMPPFEFMLILKK
ncbi:hypothetical protein XO10_03790 [Marinitoga sp. 1135]|uniref:Uncharacterized protein n=1 Tax=Marinitoga piezophila (strain DSM 14283 / JCM 11233 / KA3) TaxID=443254 RepID=H2J6K1_MARPK|nr:MULTISPECIES: hypothetical protein [Marinitoga]AEX85186.1 hypothetical protein Marpi_0756 [Marinitoga piezophila KA3]APT75679.1 hypothetical protein LN42_04220 [Marinitoga sp. 1137]NUU95420.1 hypothetical protein [Marinitoga sp. 1135]NUU97347.1 hypothetical protein [Marinitoga sp. 1138]